MLGMLTGNLPIGWLVVLEKLSPHVRAGIEAGNDRIHDSRRAVYDVERRMKSVLGGLPCRYLFRILVGHPSRIDRVHMDAVTHVVRG